MLCLRIATLRVDFGRIPLSSARDRQGDVLLGLFVILHQNCQVGLCRRLGPKRDCLLFVDIIDIAFFVFVERRVIVFKAAPESTVFVELGEEWRSGPDVRRRGGEAWRC